MISTFDITKLNALLKDFYNLTQIRITIFDENFHELAAYPENIAPFCQIIRTDEAGRNECQHCDENACRIAAKRHSLYTYQCHAGLTESIRPLYMGNIIIGYLLFGHVFAYESHEIGWKEIKKRDFFQSSSVIISLINGGPYLIWLWPPYLVSSLLFLPL